MRCFFCDSDSAGQCTKCGRFYCTAHGDVWCDACSQTEQQEKIRHWINGQQHWIRRALLLGLLVAAGGSAYLYASTGTDTGDRWGVLALSLGLGIALSSAAALAVTRAWRRDADGPPPVLERAFVTLHTWLGLAFTTLFLVVSVLGIAVLVATAIEGLTRRED
jgi:hypothetical protein